MNVRQNPKRKSINDIGNIRSSKNTWRSDLEKFGM